jgi:basic membrane protein A
MSMFSSFTKVAAGFLMSASIVAAAVPAIAADYTKDNPMKVALVLHGTLGDKSFFDDAAEGMKAAEADLPVSVKIIELGYDRSKWEAGLADAADSGYDVIIAGTFDMTGYITELSPQYPDVKFIDFDDTPDFSKCECKNVLGVQYTTAAAGYLAGYAAAKISKSGTLGTILGMEFPTVTDFKTGFDQGAKAANPNVNILNAVAGAFNDPAKGKEIALAQINQGADVVFPIAGGTGIGSLQAVKDSGKLAVGVDSDQATIFAGSDPAQAEVIFTSVLKKVGNSLHQALKATIDGTAPYGTRQLLGIKDNAVGIAKNQWYEKLVPADVRAEVDAIEQKIISGEIVVATDMK